MAVVSFLAVGASPLPAVEPPGQATVRSAPHSQREHLADFETSGHFDEQILAYRVEPGVSVRINAPPAAVFDPSLPTRLIIFALPNGNTTDAPNIMLDGKRVVSPTGGTYRRTLDMISRFRKEMPLSESPVLQANNDMPPPTSGPAAVLAVSKRYQGLDGRLDIILVENPQNRILHTVLVGDMSGFIHALTSGTPYEHKVATFGGPVMYDKWIQPE